MVKYVAADKRIIVEDGDSYEEVEALFKEYPDTDAIEFTGGEEVFPPESAIVGFVLKPGIKYVYTRVVDLDSDGFVNVFTNVRDNKLKGLTLADTTVNDIPLPMGPIAVTLAANTSLTGLYLPCNAEWMTTGDIIALSNYLATNTTLRELDLSRNRLNEESIQALSGALEQNTGLRMLCLDGKLGDADPDDSFTVGAVAALARALGVNQTLESLSLNYTIVNGAILGPLIKAIGQHPGLLHLSMRGDGIGDSIAASLGQILATHPHLLDLDLENNIICASGMNALLAGVFAGKNIQFLKLSGNPAIGHDSAIEILRNHHALQVLSYGDPADPSPQNAIIKMHTLTKAMIWQIPGFVPTQGVFDLIAKDAHVVYAVKDEVIHKEYIYKMLMGMLVKDMPFNNTTIQTIFDHYVLEHPELLNRVKANPHYGFESAKYEGKPHVAHTDTLEQGEEAWNAYWISMVVELAGSVVGEPVSLEATKKAIWKVGDSTNPQILAKIMADTTVTKAIEDGVIDAPTMMQLIIALIDGGTPEREIDLQAIFNDYLLTNTAQLMQVMSLEGHGAKYGFKLDDDPLGLGASAPATGEGPQVAAKSLFEGGD